MAWRIVKQPNGKYARFSDVVDNFTHVDMTRDEAVDLCAGYMGNADGQAEQKVANADKEPNRWSDELATIESIHGKEERDKAEKMQWTARG